VTRRHPDLVDTEMILTARTTCWDDVLVFPPSLLIEITQCGHSVATQCRTFPLDISPPGHPPNPNHNSNYNSNPNTNPTNPNLILLTRLLTLSLTLILTLLTLTFTSLLFDIVHSLCHIVHICLALSAIFLFLL